MALVGNGVRLSASNPMRQFGAASAGTVNRAAWSNPGSLRNLPTGADVSNTSAIPVGYLNPTAWVLPQKPGGIASLQRIVGEGEISGANLAGGLNGEAALSGSGTISSAAMSLVILATATLTGSGTLSADVSALLGALASLSGSGDLAGALNGALSGSATVSGSGALTAAINGVLEAQATVSGAGGASGVLSGALYGTAALTGTGGVTGSASAVANAVAALSGSGALAAVIAALGHAAATVTGSGTVTGGFYASGDMSANITSSGGILTAAQVADAVWDEILADHVLAGSTGEALAAAGSAGDPWITPLPGAYGAGTAGAIVGLNLDAAVSTRAATGAAMTLTPAERIAVATALLDYANGVETSTVREALCYMAAVLCGKATGGPGASSFAPLGAASGARVTVVADINGDRSSVVLTPP